MEISVSFVAVFFPRILTLLEAVPPSIWVSIAIFGEGIGTGPPGVGVLQTSGEIMHWPSPLVDAPKIMGGASFNPDGSCCHRFSHRHPRVPGSVRPGDRKSRRPASASASYGSRTCP